MIFGKYENSSAESLPLQLNLMFQVGACTERTTDHGTARLCACTEHKCNINGINDTIRDYQERVRKGNIKKPPDFVKIVEETVRILVDG